MRQTLSIKLDHSQGVTPEVVDKALRDEEIDLFIADIGRHENLLCEFVRRLREGESGHNQFVIAVALATAPSQDSILNTLDSGFDDLLLKPLSLDHFHRRLDRFFEGRRPFVVSSDYIGPDRRRQTRAGFDDDLAIEVPNTLAEKANETMAKNRVYDRITAARAEIDRLRIKHCAARIAWIADRLRGLATGRSGNHPQSSSPASDLIGDLRRLNEDLTTRGDRSNLNFGIEYCREIGELAALLFDRDPADAVAEVRRLVTCSRAVMKATGTDTQLLHQSASVAAAD